MIVSIILLALAVGCILADVYWFPDFANNTVRYVVSNVLWIAGIILLIFSVLHAAWRLAMRNSYAWNRKGFFRFASGWLLEIVCVAVAVALSVGGVYFIRNASGVIGLVCAVSGIALLCMIFHLFQFVRVSGTEADEKSKRTAIICGTILASVTVAAVIAAMFYGMMAMH